MDEKIMQTDLVVGKAIFKLHGFLTNAEIRAVVSEFWNLENIEPTPKMIASSMKRLGYKSYLTSNARGFFMGMPNVHSTPK